MFGFFLSLYSIYQISALRPIYTATDTSMYGYGVGEPGEDATRRTYICIYPYAYIDNSNGMISSFKMYMYAGG